MHLPLLPSERVKRQRTPPDGPFVLVEKVKGAMRLAALDTGALAFGLEPGLTLADARARIPGLVALDHDPAADAALLAWLADACERYTPSVALDPPHGLILDITGCSHRFEHDPQGQKKLAHADTMAAPQRLAQDLHARLASIGLTARLALATTPDAAIALATFGGDDVRVLPVAALRVPAETHRALRTAGLKTIAHLAERPRSPLAARFGAHVPHLLACLLGEEDVRIVPRRGLPAISVEARFAEPVARTDDALATIADLAGQAAAALTERALGGRRFEAALYRSDGHVARLAIETGSPTRDPQVLDRLFRERIDALADPLDPGFGYDLIRLDVPVTEPLGPAQLALEGGSVSAGELALLLDRLGTRLGRGRVRRFASADTHIPEQAAFELPAADPPPRNLWQPLTPGEPPLRPIHLFDPPHRIEVIAEIPDGPPHRFRWRRALHDVARVEGPERIAAEWWRRKLGHEPGKGGLTRDYYRIEDARGRRFWVFRHGLTGIERPDPDWYLHGLFA